MSRPAGPLRPSAEKRAVNVNLLTDGDWRTMEPIAGMVMLDGVLVKIEQI